MLNITPALKLPLDAVTDTFAILAVRGVGKTHTASVMAEEMLKAGQPIVAYDPTGAWWGLKSSADGKRPGFPVVVFGGEHADVPLEETAGATIATTIVEKRIPAILDCLLMRKAARIRFMTDFCETLYHKNREALHLFLDEAHTVAPQNIRAMPEAARLLGAVEDIVLQGRRRGLGLTAISQRPALLNTNIRSQCMTLIAMRIFGKHDRKAIDEWIEAHGDQATAQKMLGDLASLPKGDAWVWNAAAEIFRRVHFRERETFDSSATPRVGGRIVTPQRMAEVDLDALGAAIKATVEKAEANDPKALRAKIADLENRIYKSARAVQTAPDQAAIDRAKAAGAAERDRELRPLIQERDSIIDTLKSRMGSVASNLSTKVVSDLRALSSMLEVNGEAVPKTEIPRAPSISSAETGHRPARTLTDRRGTHVASSPTGGKPLSASGGVLENGPKAKGAGSRTESPAFAESQLPKGEAAVLSALIQFPEGLRREQLTVLTGYKRSSRDAYLQRLREKGLVESVGDGARATDAGIAALPNAQPLPTGAELQEYWLARLPTGERAILEQLIAAYPEAVSRDALGEATGYQRSSRDAYLQRMRAKQLIEEPGRGTVRASENLF